MTELMSFFNRIFGRQGSGATAKERLRLVLMSDHLSLAPEMVDEMKRELIDVVSRYVEVDRENIDVHFEHQDRTLAMLANIPITGVNRTPTPPPESPREIGSSANGARRRRRRRRNAAGTQQPFPANPSAASAT